MIKIRGNWTPNVNYDRLAKLVLEELCFKSACLTGNEIKFIRHYFKMTLQSFAKRFYITHVGVIKWEKAKTKATEMAWTTEKDIRLFVLSNLEATPKEIAELYEKLEGHPSNTSAQLELDIEKIAA
jgi:transcriptional regulator with XRE-family HTH domain